MEFGKTTQVDRIQFRLPPENDRTLEVLEHGARLRGTGDQGHHRAWLGAPVWSCPEWVGKLYPPKTPSRDFLKAYSRQFNTVEMNTTFYRIPTAETVASWKAAVGDGFRFSPKVYQEISQAGDLALGSTMPRDFFQTLGGLGDRLGTCFMQLPPHFGPNRLTVLEKFLAKLPRGVRLAVEFRHPDWFRENVLDEGAFDLLSAYGVSTVITDVAGRRDVLHASLTTPHAMIRFVGNELHPSDYSRADEWAERLKNWFAKGLREVYFFVHQPDNGNVPELAKYVIRRFNERAGAGLGELVAVEEAQLRLI